MTRSFTNNLRFPGQYFDQETGLHYNFHRYYDSTSGRFITPDPVGLVNDVNLYSYVENNPIYWIDPWGLFNSPVANPQYRAWYGNKPKSGQSKFGKTRGERYHQGVDIYAKKGTPVVAASDCVVDDIGYLKGYGKVIVLKCKFKCGTCYLLFSHLDSVNSDLKKGNKVKEGQQIGKTGDSGTKNQLSKEDHLHFEIMHNLDYKQGAEGNKDRDDPADYFTIGPAKKDKQK